MFQGLPISTQCMQELRNKKLIVKIANYNYTLHFTEHHCF